MAKDLSVVLQILIKILNSENLLKKMANKLTPDDVYKFFREVQPEGYTEDEFYELFCNLVIIYGLEASARKGAQKELSVKRKKHLETMSENEIDNVVGAKGLGQRIGSGALSTLAAFAPFIGGMSRSKAHWSGTPYTHIDFREDIDEDFEEIPRIPGKGTPGSKMDPDFPPRFDDLDPEDEPPLDDVTTPDEAVPDVESAPYAEDLGTDEAAPDGEKPSTLANEEPSMAETAIHNELDALDGEEPNTPERAPGTGEPGTDEAAPNEVTNFHDSEENPNIDELVPDINDEDLINQDMNPQDDEDYLEEFEDEFQESEKVTDEGNAVTSSEPTFWQSHGSVVTAGAKIVAYAALILLSAVGIHKGINYFTGADEVEKKKENEDIEKQEMQKTIYTIRKQLTDPAITDVAIPNVKEGTKDVTMPREEAGKFLDRLRIEHDALSKSSVESAPSISEKVKQKFPGVALISAVGASTWAAIDSTLGFFKKFQSLSSLEYTSASVRRMVGNALARVESMSADEVDIPEFLSKIPHAFDPIVNQEEAKAQIRPKVVNWAFARDAEKKLGIRQRPEIWLFAGESGTGKSEFAKKLGEHLFSDVCFIQNPGGISSDNPKQMVQEYFGLGTASYRRSESSGSPNLMNYIKSHPQGGILVLEEVDKLKSANKELTEVLREIVDTGELRDPYGESTDFRKWIIILTSNENIPSWVLKGQTDAEAEEDTTFSLTGEVQRDPSFWNRLTPIRFYNLKTRHYAEILKSHFESDIRNYFKREDVAGLNVVMPPSSIRILAHWAKTRNRGARTIDSCIIPAIRQVIIDYIRRLQNIEVLRGKKMYITIDPKEILRYTEPVLPDMPTTYTFKGTTDEPRRLIRFSKNYTPPPKLLLEEEPELPVSPPVE
ncbi:MAG: AAA family ATPase [Oscillospiraceae bacterium]|jgi:hypothetical protein|nr:AAA family ATPase [Oscillospiraceae bacterium]